MTCSFTGTHSGHCYYKHTVLNSCRGQPCTVVSVRWKRSWKVDRWLEKPVDVYVGSFPPFNCCSAKWCHANRKGKSLSPNRSLTLFLTLWPLSTPTEMKRHINLTQGFSVCGVYGSEHTYDDLTVLLGQKGLFVIFFVIFSCVSASCCLG